MPAVGGPSSAREDSGALIKSSGAGTSVLRNVCVISCAPSAGKSRSGRPAGHSLGRHGCFGAADVAQTYLLGVTDAWDNHGGVARRCITTGAVVLSTGNLKQLGKRIGGERQHDGISVAVDGPNED